MAISAAQAPSPDAGGVLHVKRSDGPVIQIGSRVANVEPLKPDVLELVKIERAPVACPDGTCPVSPSPAGASLAAPAQPPPPVFSKYKTYETRYRPLRRGLFRRGR